TGESGRLHRIVFLVAIVVAAILAFAPALRAPFVFDDIDAISRNPTIESVFPLSVSLAPPPRTPVSGRPLVTLTLAVDRAISDAAGVAREGAWATFAFHATNIVVHVLCGLLLFGIIRRTASLPSLGEWCNGLADTFAAVAAALWLLHPIQTEAVDYTIQRT